MVNNGFYLLYISVFYYHIIHFWEVRDELERPTTGGEEREKSDDDGLLKSTDPSD